MRTAVSPAVSAASPLRPGTRSGRNGQPPGTPSSVGTRLTEGTDQRAAELCKQLVSGKVGEETLASLRRLQKLRDGGTTGFGAMQTSPSPSSVRKVSMTSSSPSCGRKAFSSSAPGSLKLPFLQGGALPPAAQPRDSSSAPASSTQDPVARFVALSEEVSRLPPPLDPAMVEQISWKDPPLNENKYLAGRLPYPDPMRVQRQSTPNAQLEKRTDAEIASAAILRAKERRDASDKNGGGVLEARAQILSRTNEMFLSALRDTDFGDLLALLESKATVTALANSRESKVIRELLTDDLKTWIARTQNEASEARLADDVENIQKGLFVVEELDPKEIEGLQGVYSDICTQIGRLRELTGTFSSTVKQLKDANRFVPVVHRRTMGLQTEPAESLLSAQPGLGDTISTVDHTVSLGRTFASASADAFSPMSSLGRGSDGLTSPGVVRNGPHSPVSKELIRVKAREEIVVKKLREQMMALRKTLVEKEIELTVVRNESTRALLGLGASEFGDDPVAPGVPEPSGKDISAGELVRKVQAEFQAEMTRMREKVQAILTENGEAREEMEDLKLQLQEAREKYTTTVTELEQEREMLSEQLRMAQLALDDRDASIKDVQAQKHIAATKLHMSELSRQELEKEYARKKTQLSSLSKVEDMEQRLGSIERLSPEEIDKLKMDISQLNQAHNQLKKQMAAKKTAWENAVDQSEKLAKQCGDIKLSLTRQIVTALNRATHFAKELNTSMSDDLKKLVAEPAENLRESAFRSMQAVVGLTNENIKFLSESLSSLDASEKEQLTSSLKEALSGGQAALQLKCPSAPKAAMKAKESLASKAEVQRLKEQIETHETTIYTMEAGAEYFKTVFAHFTHAVKEMMLAPDIRKVYLKPYHPKEGDLVTAEQKEIFQSLVAKLGPLYVTLQSGIAGLLEQVRNDPTVIGISGLSASQGRVLPVAPERSEERRV
eukprot:RCo014505